jgi:tetratricopeptide (TPR) repeat protein
MRFARPSAALCCLICVLGIPGAAFSQPIEGLVNLRFQLDARVFAVMAALNLAGFDLDATNLKPDSARALVRRRLTSIGPELKNRIVEFHRLHDTEPDPRQWQGKYISFALLLNGPPHFSMAARAEELPPDARSLIGFEFLVEELWRSGGMERLWEEIKPRYLQEIESYRPLIREMIIGTLRYLHTEPRVSLDRRVTFIPDLLNGYGIMNARNIGHDYLMVVGPSVGDAKPMRSVRHEYLHFLVDPLVAKYVGYLPEAEPFLERVRQLPKSLERYQNNFYLMMTESFLQMVELRLDTPGPEIRASALIAVYKQGLILAPYFDEVLARFEQGKSPLTEVFRSFIEGIQWEVESKRAAAMEQLQSRHTAQIAGLEAAEREKSGSAAELRNLLGSANKALLAHQFDEARELLERVLRMDENNASALFGLAQVAAQNQDLDRALALYARAAANAGTDAWIAAWAFVHRGNIYRHREEIDSARAEWTKALALQGDLRGAAEAAKDALATLIK